jgi:hypothetical protein
MRRLSSRVLRPALTAAMAALEQHPLRQDRRRAILVRIKLL